MLAACTIKMRLTTTLLTLTLFSCSTNKDTNPKNDFQTYLRSLDKLETPLTFDTKRNEIQVLSQNYDTTLFKIFKHAWSMGPHGKIFENDSIVVLVDISPGDVVVPLLTTFNQHGQKLDSLNPWIKSGGDIGYESYEFLTINDKKEIIVIDSTTTWDLNEDEDDTIEGTEKLTVDTVTYKIDKKGKIIKTRG
jgi:hypothetical protein